MRFGPFGVSNIAWPSDDLPEALCLLRASGCDAVEIAPFNVFRRWDGIEDGAKRLREEIEANGMVCNALQGILYTVPDVELFASTATRARLLRHLDAIARLAQILGAGACVFGAPRQRDPGMLHPEAAWEIAVRLLREAGPLFAARGSALVFEANARSYGCRFVSTTVEAARLVAEVDTPGVGLQIDTGTIFLEAEDPNVLAEAARFALHTHVSEPDLRPPGQERHRPIADALWRGGYAGSLSIEMRQVEDWRAALTFAIGFVQAEYG